MQSTCEFQPEDKVISFIQNQLTSDLNQAESCLQKHIKRSPKNKEFPLFLIRVLGWNKKLSQAHKELSKLKKDTNTLSLRTDLLWYEGKCKNILFLFNKYSDLLKIDLIPKHTLLSYSKCALSSNISSIKKKLLIKKVNSLHPKDKEFQKLKNIDTQKQTSHTKTVKKHGTKVSTNFHKKIQSQNWEIEHLETNISTILLNQFELKLIGNYEQRNFDSKILSENVYGLGFTLFLDKHLIGLTFKKPIVSRFSYKAYFSLLYELYFSNFILGVEFQEKIYSETKVATIAPYISYTLLPFELIIKFFKTKSSAHDQTNTFQLKLNYNLSTKYIFSGWYTEGKTESQRIFLTNIAIVKSTSYGSSIKHKFNETFTLLLEAEKTKEPKFTQERYSLGTIWNF